MNLSNVQIIFAQWAKTESGGLTAVWEQQNVPRPALPYIGLLIVDLVPIGQPDLSPPDDAGIRTITGNLSLALSISYYSQNAAEMGGTDILEMLRLSLWKETVIKIFKDNDIGVLNEAMASTNTSLVVSSGFEQRYTQDLNFTLKSSITDDIGLIEKVDALGKLLDSQGQVQREVQINVDAS